MLTFHECVVSVEALRRIAARRLNNGLAVRYAN
jgi:hypothetical protein